MALVYSPNIWELLRTMRSTCGGLLKVYPREEEYQEVELCMDLSVVINSVIRGDVGSAKGYQLVKRVRNLTKDCR